MTYTEDAVKDLLRMGGDDPHAVYLLSYLFDCAVEENEPELVALRAHCAEPSTRVTSASLDFLLTTLPGYVHSWLWESDEATAKTWWTEILAALHSLRTGEQPCRSCLDVAWRIDQLASRVQGHIDCEKHYADWIYAMVSPRTPALRVVA